MIQTELIFFLSPQIHFCFHNGLGHGVTSAPPLKSTAKDHSLHQACRSNLLNTISAAPCLLLSPTSFLFVLMLRHLSACLLRGGFLHQWHPRHYGLPFWVQNRPSAIFIILLDSSSSSWHWLDLQHSVLLCANRQPGKVLLLHNL